MLTSVAAALAVLGLGACGGEGISLPSVSRSGDTIVLPSATVTIPSLSRSPDPTPEVTDTPAPEPPEPTTEAPEPTTEAPEPTRTVDPPTETVTATATPTPTETVSETPTPTPSPTTTVDAAPAPEEAEDTAGSPFLWWVLVGVLVAALVAFLVLRSRRRAAWGAELAEAESEVAWFARTLLPQLQQADSPDALAGGWRVGGADRVVAVEDRLTGLETSAPDEAMATRARDLRDAVREARLGVEGLIASRDGTESARVVSALASSLGAVLDPPAPPAPPA